MEKRNLSRRKFVATIAAGAGTIIVGNAAGAFSTAKQKQNAFQIVTLGKSGIKTTLLGMGTGFSGYNRSSNITRAGVADTLIKYAYDKGIRFFDCADNYGTHPYTARALKGLPREKYTLTTKIWDLPGSLPEPERPDANIVVDRFRKELNTDYIDLVQLHCLTSPTWTDVHKKQMDIMETLKAKGIIKAHGVSVHSLKALELASDTEWVDVIHVRINPFGNSMDSRDPAIIIPIIEKMHKSGKGIIGMKLVGNGSYKDDSEKVDQAIKFVLGLKTVDMVIVGFELPEQIDNYCQRIDKAFEQLQA